MLVNMMDNSGNSATVQKAIEDPTRKRCIHCISVLSMLNVAHTQNCLQTVKNRYIERSTAAAGLGFVAPKAVSDDVMSIT